MAWNKDARPDERHGSPASEVGIDDGTAKDKKKKRFLNFFFD